MNQKTIHFTSRFVSITLKGYLILSLILLITMASSDTFTFNSELPDPIMPLLSSGRSSGSTSASDLQIIEYINQSIVLIMSIISLFSFYLISRIFGKLASGESLFMDIQIKRMKVTSYMFLVNFILYSFLPNLLYFIFVEENYRSMTVDLGILLIALMIFVLAEVFAYGPSLDSPVNERYSKEIEGE